MQTGLGSLKSGDGGPKIKTYNSRLYLLTSVPGPRTFTLVEAIISR